MAKKDTAEWTVGKKKSPYDNFFLGTNEAAVKTYDCMRVSGKKSTITVTNKRLLFNGPEKQEIFLNRIIGIRSGLYSKINAWLVVLGVILLSAAICAFVLPFDEWIKSEIEWLPTLFYCLGGLFALLGIVSLSCSYRRTFYLEIQTVASEAGMAFQSGGRKRKNTFITARPGKDAKLVMQELGAVILNAKDGGLF